MHVFGSECSRKNYRIMYNYLTEAMDTEMIDPVDLSCKEVGGRVEFTIKIVSESIDRLLDQVSLVGILIGGAMVQG